MQKREGMAVLPEENEIETDETPMENVLPSPTLSIAIPQTPIVDETCVLCKYKVSGHIHPNQPPAPDSSSTTANQDKSSPEKSPQEDCVLCRYNVSGHVHPKEPASTPTAAMQKVAIESPRKSPRRTSQTEMNSELDGSSLEKKPRVQLSQARGSSWF